MSRPVYYLSVPKLWTETIDGHRKAVRDAALDATAALIAEHGALSLTMSQIAERTGIGRATLYHYFPDVESILTAWHHRQIARHLDHLVQVRDSENAADDRLRAVLESFALINHEHRGVDISGSLHRGEHVDHARQHLRAFLADLIVEGANEGIVRGDIPAPELAGYCMDALAGATSLPTTEAVHRLVDVTYSGLRPR